MKLLKINKSLTGEITSIYIEVDGNEFILSEFFRELKIQCNADNSYIRIPTNEFTIPCDKEEP